MHCYFMPLLLLAVSLCTACGDGSQTSVAPAATPRIVNIVNFIRQTEPRDEKITDEVLYRTVVEQVKLLHRYRMKGTFLLQYDALINPEYQSLLKNELFPGSEVGGWWEITQPHVEAAGIKWRGRFPWDWHADVGFSPGYTPEEREKLVDVYMEKFKSVFGKYPLSVGSWFIDAHTLGYMSDKYHITASCNCKDQIGTDGYTLWGGYWNQAYYPSRKNAYMPAQTEQGQIPVPVFRMLGSDPSYQYDSGVGGGVWQGVITLEPVYPKAGGNKQWVEWFFKSMFEEPCLSFAYTQAGQENSFTWDAMGKALEMQMPLLDKYYRENKISIETLGESGTWFRKNFPVTPPAAVTSLEDYREQNRKTVWYNSRYYRTNLLWKGDAFEIRDIHMFNENFESDYLAKPLTSSQCVYTTLPVVDGNMWSNRDKTAGMRLNCSTGDQPMTEAGSNSMPRVTEKGNTLIVEWTFAGDAATLKIVFEEDRTEITCKPKNGNFNWELELTAAPGASLPFTHLDGNRISGTLKGFDYSVLLDHGQVKDCRNTSEEAVYKVIPANNRIVFVYNK